MKKFTLITTALILAASASAQKREGNGYIDVSDDDRQNMYFLFDGNRLEDGQTVTYTTDYEWYDYAFADGFLCDKIQVCVDKVIKGKVEVSVESLDEQKCVFGGFGDTTHPQTWAYADWKATKEYYFVRGEKIDMEVYIPELRQEDNRRYSGRAKITLSRPDCEEGCYPVYYLPVTSFILDMASAPLPTGIDDMATDKSMVRVNGSTLGYTFANPAELTIFSASGSMEYSTVATGEGTMSLDFLPAGLHIYKAGDITGKILVK